MQWKLVFFAMLAARIGQCGGNWCEKSQVFAMLTAGVGHCGGNWCEKKRSLVCKGDRRDWSMQWKLVFFAMLAARIGQCSGNWCEKNAHLFVRVTAGICRCSGKSFERRDQSFCNV